MSEYAVIDRAASRAAHLQGFKFLSVARTHVGCVRSLNEDAFLNRADIGLWVVADGMGGHEAGEVASGMIVDTLARVSRFSSAYAFRDAVCLALTEINAALLTQQSLCGSTVVALMMYRGHYACVWAGDSRAYLYRDGVLRRLTRDHSVVQDLIENGALKPEDVRGHKSANVITRAVGAQEKLELDSVHGLMRAGDRFVLCSDGLTGMLTDVEIAAFVQRPPLEAALDKMMARSLARGAPDNVTGILIGVEGSSAT